MLDALARHPRIIGMQNQSHRTITFKSEMRTCLEDCRGHVKRHTLKPYGMWCFAYRENRLLFNSHKAVLKKMCS